MVLRHLLKPFKIGPPKPKYGQLPFKADDNLSQKPIDRRHKIYLRYESEDPLRTLMESLNEKKLSRRLYRGFEEEIQGFLHSLKDSVLSKSRLVLLRLFLVLFLLVFWSLSIIFIETKQTISVTMMAICFASYCIWAVKFAGLLRSWKRLNKSEFEDFTDEYVRNKYPSSPFSFGIYKNEEDQYLEVRLAARSRMRRVRRQSSLFVIIEEEFEEDVEEMIHQRDVESNHGFNDSE